MCGESEVEVGEVESVVGDVVSVVGDEESVVGDDLSEVGPDVSEVGVDVSVVGDGDGESAAKKSGGHSPGNLITAGDREITKDCRTGGIVAAGVVSTT